MSCFRHNTDEALIRAVRACKEATPMERELAWRLNRLIHSHNNMENMMDDMLEDMEVFGEICQGGVQ